MKLPVLRTRRPAPEGETPRRPTAPWERLFRMPRPRNLRAILQRNPGLKLVSLVLAVFLWYSITKTERDAERIIELPVSLRRIPDGLTVMDPPTKAVTVTLRGPRTILDNVDERRGRLQVGLANIALGDNRIDLSGTMLNPELPRSLKVVRFDPPSFTIRADRRTMRRLPVKPDLAGSPALGYTVSESTVTPEVVEVTGPARLLEDLKQVRTEPIELRGVEEALQRNVLLERLNPALTFVPDVVRVRVTLEESVAVRDFPKVPIAVPDGVTQVQPSSIDLSIRGPQRLLHNLKLDPDAVRIDVSGLGPGTHSVVVQVNVPDGLQVVSHTPDKVRVKVGGGRT
jgi:YbbR domain-containing protein